MYRPPAILQSICAADGCGCVCVCVFVYTNTHIHTHVHTHTYIYTHIHTYTHAHTHTDTYIHTHTHTCPVHNLCVCNFFLCRYIFFSAVKLCHRHTHTCPVHNLLLGASGVLNFLVDEMAIAPQLRQVQRPEIFVERFVSAIIHLFISFVDLFCHSCDKLSGPKSLYNGSYLPFSSCSFF
jgi:hypothetical protein